MLATSVVYDVLYYKNKQWHVLDDTESLAQAHDLALKVHLEKKLCGRNLADSQS